MNPINVFGLVLTRHCVARCDHCGSSSGPEVRGELPFELVERALGDLAELGVPSVIVTGGEPLSIWPHLRRVMAAATERGIGVQVCSNGFWARDLDRARTRVREMVELGLHHLLLSTDRFHVRYVPLDAVVHAAQAAAEHGVSCQIAVPSAPRDWHSLRLADELRRRTTATVYSHPIHPVGRGELLPPDVAPPMALSPSPCDLVGHLEVDVDGWMAVCPTSADFSELSPMKLGSLHHEALADIVERYLGTPIFRVIALAGPGGLAALLEHHGAAAGLPSGQAHPCHLCRDLTRTVERFVELAERGGPDLVTPVPRAAWERTAQQIDAQLAEALDAARRETPVFLRPRRVSR